MENLNGQSLALANHLLKEASRLSLDNVFTEWLNREIKSFASQEVFSHDGVPGKVYRVDYNIIDGEFEYPEEVYYFCPADASPEEYALAITCTAFSDISQDGLLLYAGNPDEPGSDRFTFEHDYRESEYEHFEEDPQPFFSTVSEEVLEHYRKVK